MAASEITRISGQTLTNKTFYKFKSLAKNNIQRHIQDPVKHPRWSFFAKITAKPLSIFTKLSIFEVCQVSEYAFDIDIKLGRVN